MLRWSVILEAQCFTRILMPTNLVWSDIAIRLLCTIVAGGLIGFNRGEHGRPAAANTLLVALARSVNILFVRTRTLSGRHPGGYDQTRLDTTS